MISRMLGFLTWLTLSLVIAFKFYSDFSLNYTSTSVKYLPCLLFGGIFWITWGFITPHIKFLTKRFLTSDRHWLRFLACHLLPGLIVCASHHVLMQAVFIAFDTLNWFPHSYYPNSMLLLNVSIYVALVAISYAAIQLDRNSQLEVQQANLQHELTVAQLQALRMQLRPHFFFNSLNTIRMLIETDKKKATRMTILLGEFLRTTLEGSDENEVLFSKELDVIQGYLEIQQIRFEHRIQVRMDICEDSRQVMVPSLVLQPIVENAMLHGCGKSLTDGKLHISSSCTDQILLINVWDSGSDQVSNEIVEGIGLSNTRSRLQRLYGNEGTLKMELQSAGGTLVQIEIPINRGD